MYMWIHVYIYTHLSIYIYIYTYIYISLYIYIYIFVCMYVYIDICVYMHVTICRYIRTRLYLLCSAPCDHLAQAPQLLITHHTFSCQTLRSRSLRRVHPPKRLVQNEFCEGTSANLQYDIQTEKGELEGCK